jgi:hypothetical protein
MESEHSKFGRLIYDDESYWKGQTIIDEWTIEFYIDGSEYEVDKILADYCFAVLLNFKFHLEQATKLIGSELSIPVNDVKLRFAPNSLWGFWKENGNTMFYMSFEDNQNEFANWRVQFDNNRAKYLGCDT